jgi:hypothetical protein
VSLAGPVIVISDGAVAWPPQPVSVMKPTARRSAGRMRNARCAARPRKTELGKECRQTGVLNVGALRCNQVVSVVYVEWAGERKTRGAEVCVAGEKGVAFEC